MNAKHYTTIEQSKKLLELGLNPESADMIYTMVNGRCTPFIRIETINEAEEDDVLCWSLGALLEAMPSFLVLENTPCLLYIKKYTQRYEIYYANNGFAPKGTIESNTLIEAAYAMAAWLLENGYIKKKPKTFSE